MVVAAGVAVVVVRLLSNSDVYRATKLLNLLLLFLMLCDVMVKHVMSTTA